MKKTLEGLQETADKHRDSGEINKAINSYLEIVETSKQSEKFEITANALRLAGLSAILTITGSASSRFRDAVKYLLASERVFKEIGVEEKIGDIYREVAIANDYVGNFVEAIKYYQKSIETLNKYGRKGSLATTYNKLGMHYYLVGETSTAKEYLRKSLSFYKEDPIKGHYQAEAWLDYARILIKLDDYDEAVEWAEQSLNWYMADHDGRVFMVKLAELYGLLSVLLGRENKDKLAKKYAVKYEKLLIEFDPEVSQVIRSELTRTFED